MRTLSIGAAALLAVALQAPAAQADDVTGADRILCAAVEAVGCDQVEDCSVGAPWNWNIPQFVEIDFSKNTVSTTAASGEARSSPFKHVARDGGLIVLQGVENQRAFSFVIVEETGMLTVAVARDGFMVGVFGACTPVRGAK